MANDRQKCPFARALNHTIRNLKVQDRTNSSAPLPITGLSPMPMHTTSIIRAICLLIVLTSVSHSVSAQPLISFEEITAPYDFSLQTIRQSPQGERFVQSADRMLIYTSHDGHSWTTTSLPDDYVLDGMMFYGDGTPIMQDDRDRDLIRMPAGHWRMINLPGVSSHQTTSSYLVNDTLYAYADDRFFFSVDTANTFQELFEADETIVDHSARLWKHGDRFLLHHTAGARDQLSVFDIAGNRLHYTEVDGFPRRFLFTDCGRLLLIGYNNIDVFDINDFSLRSFNSISNNAQLHYSKGNLLYAIDDGKLYSTLTCGSNANWQLVTSQAPDDMDEVWVTSNGHVLTYAEHDDRYYDLEPGATKFSEVELPIDDPFVVYANEGGANNQSAKTKNHLFSKLLSHDTWNELEVETRHYSVKYSPDGDMYILQDDWILHSRDNGIAFDTISFPPESIYYTALAVLEDDILMLFSDFNSNYYSMDNGDTWIEIDLGITFFTFEPIAVLANDKVIIADLMDQFVLLQFELGDTVAEVQFLGGDFIFNTYGRTITPDGTVYFLYEDIYDFGVVGIYKCTFGSEPQLLSSYEGFGAYTLVSTSAGDILVFGRETYYRLENDVLVEYPLLLPASNSNSWQYFHTDNDHLYVVLDRNRMFRSKEPLAESVSTSSPQDQLQLTVSPNPAGDFLNLGIENADTWQIQSIEILDLQGRVMQVTQGQQFNGLLDIGHLVPGPYIIVVVSDDLRQSCLKFIKK